MRPPPPTRLALPHGPRELRTRCLTALGRAVDAYLRSPLFLAWIRHGLGAANQAQVLQARSLTFSMLHRDDPRRQ
jgi:hypothetical protein